MDIYDYILGYLCVITIFRITRHEITDRTLYRILSWITKCSKPALKAVQIYNLHLCLASAGNGYIPTTCLREILRELDDQLTNEELDMMIEEIDSDGSGTVDFDGTFLLYFPFFFRWCISKVPDLSNWWKNNTYFHFYIEQCILHYLASKLWNEIVLLLNWKIHHFAFFWRIGTCLRARNERKKAKRFIYTRARVGRSRMPLISRLRLFLYAYSTNRSDLSRSHALVSISGGIPHAILTNIREHEIIMRKIFELWRTSMNQLCKTASLNLTFLNVCTDVLLS